MAIPAASGTTLWEEMLQQGSGVPRDRHPKAALRLMRTDFARENGALCLIGQNPLGEGLQPISLARP
jgi:hypothetical protein